MPTLRELGKLRGYGVEWVEPGHIVISRRNRLFTGVSVEGPFRPLGFVPTRLWRRLAAAFRPLQRLLRHSIYNVLRIADDRYFVTFNRTLGVLGPEGFEFLKGWSHTARVLRGACAIGPDGAVYFGAYLNNRGRGPVEVFRYGPGDSRVEVVHTFPPRSVRHVHGVYVDPSDHSLWVTTGDLEHECQIFRTTDCFTSLERIGGGDETWRAVSLQFLDAGVVYGTDAEFRENWLYILERHSGIRRRLQSLEGPVYYSTAAGEQLYFAVTAELCPSQTRRSAALWSVGADLSCTRIARFDKDWLPTPYFLPGTLDFPNGPGQDDQLFFRCTAVVPDNRVMGLHLTP
jgi:hypothetical protein